MIKKTSAKWVLIFGFVAAGCNNTHLEQGHYEGNLLRIDSNQYSTAQVQMDLVYNSKTQATLTVQDESQNRTAIVIVTQSKDQSRNDQISLTYEGPNFDGNLGPSYSLSQRMPVGPFILHRIPATSSKDTQCYSDSGTLMETALCYTKKQFRLAFKDEKKQPLLTLYGSQFRKDPPYELEAPAAITLSRGIDEALNRQYDAKFSIEHVFQAKNAALAAWLNLIPHITTNLIWNFDPGYISAIATMQALTPFLLPTYWLEAKNADINTIVQEDFLQIIRANLATTMEQLSYSYVRDAQIAWAHQQILSELDRVHNQDLPMALKEAFGTIEKVLPDLVHVTSDGINRVLLEDRYALSVALGKHNPDAVSGVEIGVETMPYEQAKPIDQQGIANWAIARSFEIKQIDCLIQIANTRHIEMYFGWIDPSSDQRTSLGFNLIGQERVVQSQIKELSLKREQIQQLLFRDAYIAVLDYNQALAQVQQAKVPGDIPKRLQEFRILLESQLVTAHPNTEPLVEWVRKFLGEEIGYESKLAAFRMARAKIDRLLLSGYFEKLLPQFNFMRVQTSLKSGKL